MKTAIAYIRVSTQKQGRSGLGLEAQRTAIAAFAAAEGFEILDIFVEVETGKGIDDLAGRPQLASAIEVARLTGSTVVVAKLDRLTRNSHFGTGLIQRGKVAFRIADMPHADNFQIQIMLAVAEKEAEAISRRTIDALAAAKVRGTKLGGAANSKAVADRAAAFAESLRAEVTPLMGLSSRKIAAVLNERCIATADGGAWQSAQVIRLINRLGVAA